MIIKTFAFLALTALSLIPQLSNADDFLDMLNAEAMDSATKKNLKEPNFSKSKQQLPDSQTNQTHIMDKIAAKDSAYLPKNKNELDYRAYLKNMYYKTYIQYMKLGLNKREIVYEQYAKSSFPRIEKTQEAIKKLLK